MRAVSNPIMLRATIVLFFAAFAFLIGLLAVRMLRRNLDEELDLETGPTPSLENLPFHVYNTVIQQLKQQKHELQVQSQAEQRRSRATENFSQAVLSNLSCGVVVFGINGLVKQTNPAAREILGFASPTGMSVDDIFRKAAVNSSAPLGPIPFPDGTTSDGPSLAEEVHSVLREGSSRRQVEVDYTTPAGQKRYVAVTVSPVPAADGGLLGAACLINDLSEFARIQREQQLQQEISAEMALKLRSSLDAISGYTQQLAHNCNPELVKQLSADIASEAAHLDRSIVGLLSEKFSKNAERANSSADIARPKTATV